MKWNKLFFILFITSIAYGQYDVANVGNSGIVLNNSRLLFVSQEGSVFNGDSPYLLDNWDSKGYLTTKDESNLSIVGINYDIKNNAFVVKIAKDSIYMFDDAKFKEVLMEGRRFKPYNNVGDIESSKALYLEVLGTCSKVEILRYHGKKLKFGKKDLRTGVLSPDRYVDFNKTFSKKGDVIEEIKLNKKQFSQVFEDKAKSIDEFISNNKLSLKSEENIQKILNYYMTL